MTAVLVRSSRGNRWSVWRVVACPYSCYGVRLTRRITGPWRSIDGAISRANELGYRSVHDHGATYADYARASKVIA